MNSFYTMECKLLSFVRALFVSSEKKEEEEEVSDGDGTAEYCVICLCKIERAVHEDHGITSGAVDIALRCGHVFHKHCFDGWVKIQRGKQAPAKAWTKTTCPLCRARIVGGGDVNGRLITSPGNSTDSSASSNSRSEILNRPATTLARTVSAFDVYSLPVLSQRIYRREVANSYGPFDDCGAELCRAAGV
ncbi:hypothetical protein KSP39_PZI018661 [Platanthera zijinensis]|uniref:RING-type domain-containing protein n=1 Tax=Platanthera zijinensis TaxID=2320716 RepID=A0AAP0FYV4_9ASPA